MIRDFFLFICLVLSILALKVAAGVDHVNEASVTIPAGRLAFTLTSPAAVLKRPIVIASQPSPVSANLRKKEDIEVDLEDVSPFAHDGPYQVELVYYWPSLNNPDYTGAGVATIGPTVEYPAAYYGYFSVNMRLRKMIITFILSGDADPYAEFNGPVVTSLTSGANLPQPAYFISSTINTSMMTLTSTPTTIALNWPGVSFTEGDTIVIGW